MIVEMWWKVALASIATVAVAKFFGCPWSIAGLFAVSMIAWMAIFIIAIIIEGWWMEKKK